MTYLTIAIIIVLLLLAVIFLAPFHISLNMEKDGTMIQGFYRIGWLGVTLHRGKIYPKTPEDMKAPRGELAEEKTREDVEKKAEEVLKEEDKQPIKPPSKRPSKQPSKQPSMPSPDPRELIEALPALARVFVGLIRSIDMEKISCRISFGLNDPAETAAMSGYLWSIASVIGLYRADVYIEPYFEGERLDGRFFAEIKARLLWITLALAKAVTEEKIRRLFIGIVRREMTGREPAQREPA